MAVPIDFWVATAGIAPVIALAHALNIGRYVGWQHTLIKNTEIQKRRFDRLSLKGDGEVGKAEAELRQFEKISTRCGYWIGGAIWISCAALVACAVAMFQALLSLRADSGSEGSATAVLVQLVLALTAVGVDAGLETITRFTATHALEKRTLGDDRVIYGPD